MALDDLTLIELHLHGDSEIGSGLLGGRGRSGSSGSEGTSVDVSSEDERAESGDEEDGGGLMRVLVPLLILVGIAVAVRRMRSGGEHEMEAEVTGAP